VAALDPTRGVPTGFGHPQGVSLQDLGHPQEVSLQDLDTHKGVSLQRGFEPDRTRFQALERK